MRPPIPVLCVDDDPQVVDLVTTYLDREFDDFRTYGETDPSVALERVRELPVECVVSDYQMPEVDGLELLDRVREDDPDLPFILFTGRGSESVASEAVSAGVTDYIRKSVGTQQYDLLANRIRNAVERRRARTSYREVFDAANDAILVIDPDSRTLADANRAAEELWGYDAAALDSRPIDTLVEDLPAEVDRLGEQSCGATTVDVRCVRADGEPFWAGVSLERATVEGYDRLLAVVRDVTERRERERAIRDLVDGQQELLAASTPDDIAASAASTALDSLSFEATTLYVRSGDGLAELAAAGTPVPRGRRDRATAALGADDCRVETTAVWRELHVPVGDRGVLVGVVPRNRSFRPYERSLVRALATSVDTALERCDRERQLRERGRRLERRRDQYGRLDRITTLLRDVHEVLVGASSQEEIERRVCDRLVATDGYCTAWMGRVDGHADRLEPVAISGRPLDEFDAVDLGDGTAADPLTTAVVEREPQFLQDRSLSADTGAGDPWSREHRSVAYVPVVSRSAVYGVIGVGADEVDAFGDRDRAVLADLGSAIGAAINAHQRKRALFADETVELEFEITSSDSMLADVSRSMDQRVEIEGILGATDDCLRLFVTMPALDVDALAESASRSPIVRSIEPIAGHDGACEVTARRSALVNFFLDHGIALGRMVAEDGRCRMVLELPATADVRQCVATVEDAYEDATLVARRERAPGETTGRFRASLEEQFTDRQHEVLRTAFESGFFDWPRRNSGEDVAARLDINQSTFHEHLRSVERKTFAALFAEAD